MDKVMRITEKGFGTLKRIHFDEVLIAGFVEDEKKNPYLERKLKIKKSQGKLIIK